MTENAVLILGDPDRWVTSMGPVVRPAALGDAVEIRPTVSDEDRS